jgi:hypothetical protein
MRPAATSGAASATWKLRGFRGIHVRSVQDPIVLERGLADLDVEQPRALSFTPIGRGLWPTLLRGAPASVQLVEHLAVDGAVFFELAEADRIPVRVID